VSPAWVCQSNVPPCDTLHTQSRSRPRGQVKRRGEGTDAKNTGGQGGTRGDIFPAVALDGVVAVLFREFLSPRDTFAYPVPNDAGRLLVNTAQLEADQVELSRDRQGRNIHDPQAETDRRLQTTRVQSRGFRFHCAGIVLGRLGRGRLGGGLVDRLRGDRRGAECDTEGHYKELHGGRVARIAPDARPGRRRRPHAEGNRQGKAAERMVSTVRRSTLGVLERLRKRLG